MGRIWHKKKRTRILLIVIANIMVISIVAGAWHMLTYESLIDDLLSGELTGRYEETYDFNDALINSSYQVLSGIESEKMFETDGKVDVDKLVDIQDFYKNSTITGQDIYGLTYRLGDLVDWYNSLTYGESTSYAGNTSSAGNAPSDTSEVKAPIVCKLADGSYHYYSQDEFNNLIQNGELKFIMADGDGMETTQQILDELENAASVRYDKSGDAYVTDSESLSAEKPFRGIQDQNGVMVYTDCWKYDGMIFAENVSPQGEQNLLDLVNHNSNWNGRLNDAYNMLEGSIYQIGDMYHNYQSLTDQYEEGDSNYFYYYKDLKSGRVVTNRESLEQEKNLNDVAKKVQKMGKYVIVKSKLSDFQTNIEKADAEEWQSQIIYMSDSEDGDFAFMTGVDTTYPVKDSYYKNALFYEKNSPVIRGIGAGIIAALLTFLACTIWLVTIAGRTEKDGELHLYRFDRCKTEIGAAVIIVAWVIPSMIGVLALNSIGLLQREAVITGTHTVTYGTSLGFIGLVGIALYTCNMFLTGVLSLARRIKAGIAWKNSFLCDIIEFIKLMARNAGHIAKIVVLYLGYVAVHWIVCIAAGWVSTFWVLVLLIVQTVGFVVLVNGAIGRQKIKEGVEKISEGELDYKINLEEIHGEQKRIAEQVNSIGSGLDAAVEKNMKSERLKTDLITNVSHDIKTPLTSIINYVNLLKQENFEDPKIQRYIEVLEEKSLRLKTLTEDVVEASKVSSGNISLEFMNINMVEMIQQTSGEFEEKFQARNLTEIMNLPEEAIVRVDGRRMWRVLENIYNNAAKYAMEGTRIYADLQTLDGKVIFSLKNISEQPLNISSAEELTERFIRGDLSRSTEGSGLGLSIAKTLTTMMGGTFDLYLDGDLFKVVIIFDKID